jgi:hypothetical protein
MSGVWQWGGVAWSTSEHTGQPFWEHVEDSYVPLTYNLQRVIVRDGMTAWTQVQDLPNLWRPGVGVMTYVCLVGTDGGGLNPVETQHVPVIWTIADVTQTAAGPFGKAYGFTPNLNMDLTVRRTNGVDRNTQTHVQVRRIFNIESFAPADAFPNFYGAGEMLHLSHAPASP